MTFDDVVALRAAVIDALERPDIEAAVPGFIALAEADLSQVEHPAMVQRTGFAGSDAIEVPVDYRSMIALTAVGFGPLQRISAEDFDTKTAIGDLGFYYATIGERIYLPSNLDGAEMRMTYRRKLDALGNNNPTNWVLKNYPGAYFYGALKHAAIYTVEDGRVPMWQGLFDTMLEQIRRDGVAYNSTLVSPFSPRRKVI